MMMHSLVCPVHHSYDYCGGIADCTEEAQTNLESFKWSVLRIKSRRVRMNLGWKHIDSQSKWLVYCSDACQEVNVLTRMHEATYLRPGSVQVR